MVPAPPTNPALLVYFFVDLDGERAGWVLLNRLWRACWAMGTTEPSFGGMPTETLPGAPVESRSLQILASARRGDGGPLRSAFVFTEHGIAGLVAALSADQGSPQGWSALIDEWLAVAPEPGAAGLVGDVMVLVEITPDGVVTDTDLAALHVERLGALTSMPVHSAAPGEALAREFRTVDESRRVFVVTAPAAGEQAVDEWAWAVDGQHGLAPFTRYCLNVARARRQLAVYRSLRPVSDVVAETDAATRMVVVELAESPSDKLDPGRLLAADRRLQALQLEHTGLLWRTTRLKEMAQTVRALRANIKAIIGSEPAAGFFARDDTELAWLIDQIDRDAVYLDVLSQRTNAAHTTANSLVTQTLQRRSERLTLLQTSIIGALLMMLAAIQSFQYTAPIDAALKSPLITVLSCAAFALPFLVARWSGLVSRTMPCRWPDLLAAAALGASTGWLISSVIWLLAAHRLAPSFPTAVAVAMGALLVALPTWFRREATPLAAREMAWAITEAKSRADHKED